MQRLFRIRPFDYQRKTGSGRHLSVLAALWVLAAAAAAAVILLSPLAGSVSAETENDIPPVYMIGIQGGIGPATTEFVEYGLKQANENDAQLLIITMNTPGGLMSATRDIIQLILNSPVPVASLVYPQGAQAASAGTYILYASHIAAMAPACTTGAATPIQMMGARLPAGAGQPVHSMGIPVQPEEEEEPGDEDTPSDELSAQERKVINEAVSFIRELADKRGRNADWAEKAVRDAASIQTSAAKEMNIIDYIANSPEELLEKTDGLEVDMNGKPVILRTAGSEIVHVEPNWRTRLLTVITNPNIAYILLIIGLYGLLLEGYSPGAIVPGVAGTISLLLALYALQILPVNLVGVVLILFGVILMVSETFVPSFGILGFGGVISIVLGGIFLVDPNVPGFGVDPAFIGAIGATLGIVFLALTAFLIRARQRPVAAGKEELPDTRGRALSDFENGAGSVFVRGERWRARSDHRIRKDDPVRVTGIDGLTLTVRPDADKNGNEPDEP